MEFTKIQGLGDDFIIINNIKLKLSFEKLSKLAARLCQKQISIGANGFIVIDKPKHSFDFEVSAYDVQGSPAPINAIGAGCAARYAYEHNIAREHMVIETTSGIYEVLRLDKGQFKIRSIRNGVIENDELIGDTNILAIGSITDAGL